MNNSKNMVAYRNMQVKIMKVNDGVYIVGSKVENKGQNQLIRLHILENGLLKHPFMFPMSKLKASIMKINDYGYELTPIQMKELLQILHNQYGNLPMIRNVYNLGWQLQDGEVIGYQGEMMIAMEGNEVASDPYLNLPDSSGNINIELLKQWMENNVKRQLVFLCQPSAIIAGLLKRNVVFSIYGKSSTGKTTAAKLSQSCFASENYDKINLTFNGTENGLLKQLEGMRGIGVLIDDTSLSDKKDYTRLVYKLALGSDKARLNSKDFQVIHTAKWATSIILTTETSILDRCNPDMEGVLGRMIEMKVEGNDLFNDAEECNNMQAYYKYNYGLLTPEIVKYLLKNDRIAKIEKLYEKEIQGIRSTEITEGVLQRLYETFAIITLTARILNEILEIEFNITEIVKHLATITQIQLDIMRSQQTDTIIVNEVYDTILEKSLKVGFKEIDRVFVKSPDYRKILKETSSIFNISVTDINRVFKEKRILLPKDKMSKEYSITRTIDGNSKRGFMLGLPKGTGELSDVSNGKNIENADNTEEVAA